MSEDNNQDAVNAEQNLTSAVNNLVSIAISQWGFSRISVANALAESLSSVTAPDIQEAQEPRKAA